MIDIIGQTQEGFSVISTYRIEGWKEYEVTPENPIRVFAGVATIFYNFPDENVFKGLTEETVLDAEGNPAVVKKELKQAQEVDLTPAVPLSVSPRQFYQAMNHTPFGDGTLRDAAEALVAASDQDMKDWWDKASSFDRYHPQIMAIGAYLGLTDVQLDELWALAGSM